MEERQEERNGKHGGEAEDQGKQGSGAGEERMNSRDSVERNMEL